MSLRLNQIGNAITLTLRKIREVVSGDAIPLILGPDPDPGPQPLIPPPRVPLPVVIVQIDNNWHPAFDIVDPAPPLYFSDGRYIDISAGIVADARLSGDITFERRISTIFWGGGRSRASIGDITLINDDGTLDHMLPFRDKRVRIYLGNDEQPLSAFTLVAVALIERVESVEESKLRVVTNSLGAAFSRAVLGNEYSMGDQIGRPKPRTYGIAQSVPALPTDIANLRFSVHDSAAHEVQHVYDRGAERTLTTQWLPYNTNPHHGFELLQATVGRITAQVRGRVLSGGASTLPNVIACIMSDAGWTGGYDAAAVADLQTELGSNFGLGSYVDGSLTYQALLDDVADSLGGYWCVNRLGEFVIDRLRVPSGPAAISITETELASGVSVNLDTAPGLSTVVAGDRNWHVHSSDELAGSVRDTTAGQLLTRDYRSRAAFGVHSTYGSAAKSTGATREVVSATMASRDTASGATGARRVRSDYGHGTLIVGALGVADEAARRGALWEAPRYWYSGSVELAAIEAATLDAGEDIALTVIDRATGQPRHGLDAKPLVAVGVRGVIGRGLVELTLWGDGPEED